MRNFQREEDQMQAVPMGYMAQPFIQSNVNVVSQPMANLNQMQLPSGQLLGNFNQLREERPVGMVPFERMDRMPISQEGQMGQMAILGGLPSGNSGVMPAFCAQLLGASMPGPMEPQEKAEELRPPWMLPDLSIRDLDNLPRNLLPEQPMQSLQSLPHTLPGQGLPQSLPGQGLHQSLPGQSLPGQGLPQSLPGQGLGSQNLPGQSLPGPGLPSSLPGNQSPLLTLQQQQLILQQLQNPGNNQPGPPPMGFMQDLPGQQMQFNQMRMQGVQNLANLPGDLDTSPQLPLQDLEDKNRMNRQAFMYNAGVGPPLPLPRMEDDLSKSLLMDGLAGLPRKGKGKPDENLVPFAKLGDRPDLLPVTLGKGKKGSKDGRPGLAGTGPSGPSGKEKGRSSKGEGEASFTTSGIGKMRYGNSPNKLFIGNLSLEVTSDDLVEALKPAGDVLGVRLRQGRYSSIAFAEFRHPGCVDIAVRTLQGLIIKGRPARMEFQSGKNDREEDEAKDKGKGKKGRRGSLKGNAVILQPGPVPPGPVATRPPPTAEEPIA